MARKRVSPWIASRRSLNGEAPAAWLEPRHKPTSPWWRWRPAGRVRGPQTEAKLTARLAGQVERCLDAQGNVIDSHVRYVRKDRRWRRALRKLKQSAIRTEGHAP